MYTFVVIAFLLQTVFAQSDYDYVSVIQASSDFYKIQRSGRLPDNDIPWRGDSFLDDGQDVGLDLSGGYFDAGDHVKFMFPHAAFTTIINWGLIDWTDGYEPSVLPGALQTVRWSLDFMIKTHAQPNLIYGQIGDGQFDHNYWGRPEDWPYGPRPSYNISSESCGSELAGEYAAAFASGYLVFRETDPNFANQLLQHAKDAFEFAYNCRGFYTDSVPAASFYGSSFYGDELGWSAAWLLRATNDQLYKTRLDSLWNEFSYQDLSPTKLSWGDKTVGIYMMGAKVTGEQKYFEKVIAFCDNLLYTSPRTPKGLLYLDMWGTLRHASNAVFICLNLAEMGVPKAQDYRDLAKQQIGYALGDTGRSFVVGWGVNPPASPHHRAGSCPPQPQECVFDDSNQPNFNIVMGGLVGGPDENDNYEDDRADYVHNEVACDYNAGFQSACAALHSLKKRENSAGNNKIVMPLLVVVGSISQLFLSFTTI